MKNLALYADKPMCRPADRHSNPYTASWRQAGSEFQHIRAQGRNLLLCLLMGFVLFPSCKPEVLTEEALQSWVREPGNGLIKTEERGNLQISAVYRPTDLLVVQELGEVEATPEDIERLRSKFGAYRYFILSISHNGRDALYSTAGSYAEFSDNLQKLSFRMHDYLHMTTSGKDTVYMADYHFARMHGMAGSTQVLLAFEAAAVEDSKWVQLNLKEIGFGTGRVNLRFKTEALNDIPGIDFYNKGNRR
jgi:hypothetical protein